MSVIHTVVEPSGPASNDIECGSPSACVFQLDTSSPSAVHALTGGAER